MNLKGELKESKKYISEIIFEFRIESLVYLTDSVLAFHKHGMVFIIINAVIKSISNQFFSIDQVGKSLKNCETTQEITDMSRMYRVLNMERFVLIKNFKFENFLI